MSGVGVQIIDRGLDDAIKSASKLVDFEHFELMDVIGRLVQNQTRQRIVSEKEGPDGTAWVANHEGTSTLYASGALHDSIDYQSGMDEVEIGSALVYAAIHQFGGVIKPKKAKSLSFMKGNARVYARSVNIPARPYLGLSADNIDEINSVVSDFLIEVMQ